MINEFNCDIWFTVSIAAFYTALGVAIPEDSELINEHAVISLGDHELRLEAVSNRILRKYRTQDQQN